MKKFIKKHANLIFAMLFLMVVAWSLNDLYGYSLTTRTTKDGAVEIQTLILGEYYTPVTLLEIYEMGSGDKVVSLRAKSENSRMHTVTINVGANRFNDDYLDGYTVEYQKASAYEFKSNTKYKVRVKWGWMEKEKRFVLYDKAGA